MKLYFTFGGDYTTVPETKGFQIDIDLEQWLVPGRMIVDETDAKCFYPIFVTDPAKYMDVFQTWFLGNIFYKQYVVFNEIKAGKLQIGIHDKRNPTMLAGTQIFVSPPPKE